MFLKCPYCKSLAKYIKDDKLEPLGWYTFKCECGEEYMVLKSSPLIVEHNEK